MDTARHSRNQRRKDHHGLHRFHGWERRGKRKMNLNSRTHEQINQPVSRQDAKAQRSRERRGNLAGKQETAGKQEESRFNHRGPPRGTEGERKRWRGDRDNILYSIRNIQFSRFLEGLPVRRGGTSVLPGIGDPNSQSRHGWTQLGERGESGS